jgi:acyl carrier protein
MEKSAAEPLPPAKEEALEEFRRGVVKALENTLKKELPQATWETRLFDDLSLDSTAVLEVLMELEEQFGIVFDPDDLELEHLSTVRALAEFVRQAQNSMVDG